MGQGWNAQLISEVGQEEEPSRGNVLPPQNTAYHEGLERRRHQAFLGDKAVGDIDQCEAK